MRSSLFSLFPHLTPFSKQFLLTVAFAMMYITVLGLINAEARQLSEAIREQQVRVELRQCTSLTGETSRSLKFMADILSSLSKLDV